MNLLAKYHLTSQGRTLTDGEKVLAKTIFANAINLNTIKLYQRAWIKRHYAFSPNGHIYFNPHDLLSDFSTAPLHKQAWLIHELTHVWQVQQGLRVFSRALLNRKYRYVLKEGKHFLQYGIEQQAQMVQDYFMAKAQGKDCQALQNCIPF